MLAVLLSPSPLPLPLSPEVKNRTVVLTESNWIEMKMAEGVDPPQLPNPSSCALLSKELGTKAQKQKKHKPLIEIHSVEIEPIVAGAPHPYAFRICFFSGSAASIAKAGFGKLKRVFSLSSDFDSFLKSKVVRCHSAEECSQWVTVFHCLLRNTWQSKIEKEILPEPEIYKRHAFVIKQHNDRLVLLSDFWSVPSGGAAEETKAVIAGPSARRETEEQSSWLSVIVSVSPGSVCSARFLCFLPRALCRPGSTMWK